MHAVPHTPQFCASLLVSLQLPLQHFIEPPPQRASSLQPGTQVEVAPSTLQTLPVGQSVSATQATQRPSRQMGVAPVHAGLQPRGPSSTPAARSRSPPVPSATQPVASQWEPVGHAGSHVGGSVLCCPQP